MQAAGPVVIPIGQDKVKEILLEGEEHLRDLVPDVPQRQGLISTLSSQFYENLLDIVSALDHNLLQTETEQVLGEITEELKSISESMGLAEKDLVKAAQALLVHFSAKMRESVAGAAENIDREQARVELKKFFDGVKGRKSP